MKQTTKASHEISTCSILIFDVRVNHLEFDGLFCFIKSIRITKSSQYKSYLNVGFEYWTGVGTCTKTCFDSFLSLQYDGQEKTQKVQWTQNITENKPSRLDRFVGGKAQTEHQRLERLGEHETDWSRYITNDKTKALHAQTTNAFSPSIFVLVIPNVLMKIITIGLMFRSALQFPSTVQRPDK